MNDGEHNCTYEGPDDCCPVCGRDRPRETDITVRVENVTMSGVDREEPAYEVIVASSYGDYSWGYWDGEAVAEAEAARLREMFDVIAEG